jgi:hypothetical protein
MHAARWASFCKTMQRFVARVWRFRIANVSTALAEALPSLIPISCYREQKWPHYRNLRTRML